MNGKQIGRDQRDYIKFRESDSYDESDGSFTHSSHKLNDDKRGRFSGRNRYGEEKPRHDHYQDDQFRNDYDPTYEDEYGMKHPYEHGGRFNRWSDDLRSEASLENHSGKGPKGYTRSSERIIEEANEILARDWLLDATDIEVDYKEGLLILKGSVHSRRDKRHAEHIVEHITGVKDVLNQLSLSKHIEGWIPGIGNIHESDSKRGGKDG
jgi:hypothetical protein